MKKYKLICMSFDGDYQTERPEFETIEQAWDYSNDLGSKWYFYPFHFVVTASVKTIKDAPYPLDYLIGSRVSRVSRDFETLAKLPDAQNLDADNYAFFVATTDVKKAA